MNEKRNWTEADWQRQALRLAKQFAAGMIKPESKMRNDYGRIIDLESSGGHAVFSMQDAELEKQWTADAEKGALAYSAARNGKKKSRSIVAFGSDQGISEGVRNWIAEKSKKGWWARKN